MPEELNPTIEELNTKIRILEAEKKETILQKEVVEPQIFQPIKDFDTIKVRKLLMGLPVLTAVPTYTGWQGETVLVVSGASYYIYSYINSAWRGVGLTL